MSAPRPRPGILRVSPYVGGESRLAGQNRVIKLSSNEGAFGAPPGARAAYLAAAGELHRYPDGRATALREAIGARWGLEAARIVCGAGSDDLIYLLASAYGGPGTETIVTTHAFAIYALAAEIAGGIVRRAAERDLTADVDAILAQVTARTRLVFLANPNNPTGTFIAAREVKRLRAGLPQEVLLVLDAAYAEYVTRPDYEPGIGLVDAGANTVMTRTFSKIFGLGGLRLGWAYAPAGVVDVLNRVRAPFNVNAAAAAVGIAALAEAGWVERNRAHNQRARTTLAAALAAAGISAHPSEANFLLVEFATPAVAAAADADCRARGIIVRRVASYGLANCLRISIGTDEECALVAEALEAFMQRAGARG